MCTPQNKHLANLHAPPTFVFASALVDLADDEGVGDEDDGERQHVDGDDVEQVVGELVRRRREEVERDALREPRVLRVVLHVEDGALQVEKGIGVSGGAFSRTCLLCEIPLGRSTMWQCSIWQGG